MSYVPISEAKAKLASLVREVAATGEPCVISVNGQPLVEIRPYKPQPQPGRFRDAISFDEDAFDPISPGDAESWGL